MISEQYTCLEVSGNTDICVPDTFYVRHGKRILDIVIASLCVIISLPINILLAIITFFDVGRPIFFRQKRIGKEYRPFTIVKFRNMRNDVDGDGFLLPPRQRVTKIGRVIRASSLDELLQFWNIILGHMSVIGPRPLKPSYVEIFNSRHKMRYAVRPGLECPILGILGHPRTWNDQFENDIWYVEHISLKTDLLLMLHLVRMVFDRKYAKLRSGAIRGTFIGYRDGIAISEVLSDKDRMERKIRSLEKRYQELYSDDIEKEGT